MGGQGVDVVTRVYSTTNIVISPRAMIIFAEDLSYDTPADEAKTDFAARAGTFIEGQHMRVFAKDAGIGADSAMHKFTTWLHEVGAVVDQCWVLSDTLDDEERQP